MHTHPRVPLEGIRYWYSLEKGSSDYHLCLNYVKGARYGQEEVHFV